MIVQAWLKFAFTTMLFLALLALVIHYYRPRRKEDADRVEQPKYRMLDDDDQEPPR